MGMQVGTFIQTPIIRKWSDEVSSNLSGFIVCQHFTALQTLIKKFIDKNDQSESSYLVLLEVENELFPEYLNQLLSHSSKIKVLACGFPKSIEEIKMLFKLGIKGYVDVTFSDLEFLRAIKEVKNENYYLPNGKINELISDFISGVGLQLTTQNGHGHNGTQNGNLGGINNEICSSYTLTEKEKVVVEYLLKGYSYKQIAALISLTPFAVNQRAKNVFKKCGVRSRSELSYLLLK